MKMEVRPVGDTPRTAMRISGIGSAMPEYRFAQHEIAAALHGLWEGRLQNPRLINLFHQRARVDFRYLAFPLERYPQFSTWGETNKAWFEVAQELGERAIDNALHKSGMARDELDSLTVVSISGVASPSLDARLINRMGLRRDIKRTPIFGVGCVGGALGLTRAADHTLAYPRQNAALLSVELCSLTLQRQDLSTANLISAALFGDGAAAVIVTGQDSPATHRAQNCASEAPGGPLILGTESVFYPGTEDMMGWEISEKGFRIILSAQLPEFIRASLSRDVAKFLRRFGLRRADVGSWVIHTGGPKVLEAIQDSLALPDVALEASWDCLRQYGNLSSTSVLLVLEDVAANRRPAPGTIGLLLAMGPGFCSELILLKW